MKTESLTDNSRAAGISKFPFNRVLTCRRVSNDSGVITYSNLFTGSMFLTIPVTKQNINSVTK